MKSLRPLTLIAMLGLLLVGCGTTVPMFSTAEAQYKYADDKVILAEPVRLEEREGNVLDSASMTSRYRPKQYHEFIEHFQAVVNNFPADPVYTPRALLRIAEYHFQLRELPDAIIIYRDLIAQYPDDDLIQVGAHYGLGNVFLYRDQLSQAQEQYNLLINQYAASTNPQIRELVQRAYERMARLRYQTR